MSGEDQDKVETPAEEPIAKKRPQAPAQVVLGRLVGAAVALPTAALTYLTGLLSDVPATTAIGRSVIAGAIMWYVLSFGVRILARQMLIDWRRERVAPGRGKDVA